MKNAFQFNKKHYEKSSHGAQVAYVLAIIMFVSPQLAMAAGNPLQSMLDAVIAFLNSGVMRSIAILAVMGFGIAAYLGKISWDWAIKICAGVIFTFGAPALVDQFSAYV